ncbi:hypothetical protein EIP91_009610 [Steccherinum ochraceum]|uniref:NADH:flavin oxidoreductase/NADH oxidase N-terminal domain-containing protein n=1 Tax=Steccherinum ochraceum TaxID=92696 RepID=A0A4R0R1H1_9APHY|nr:hypothetical protein EIP91_009610 [Steccherinum ochraceum]
MSASMQRSTESQGVMSEVQLPCGRTLQNRLVKAAMYEHLASFLGGPPNDMHFALYSRWASGDWGMIITGNVQVASNQLGLGRDVVVPDVVNEESVQPFKKLASIIHDEDTHTMHSDTRSKSLAIMQISHTGRQSPNFLGGRLPFVPPKAPSAIPLDLKTKRHSKLAPLFAYLAQSVFFQTPRAMSLHDIELVVDQFVKASELAAKAGFDGVQLHAAHGYLISQFMSQRSNNRMDEFSSKTDPLRFLRKIVSAIRTSGVVPEDFVLGVKLNAADYVESAAGLVPSEERALEHLRGIASWGMVDFIEVSGGDYDTPDFLVEANTSRRQGVFAEFSRRAVQTLTVENVCPPGKARPLIMLTGGLHSTELMTSALARNHADLVGLARVATHDPELPKHIAEDASAPLQNVFPFHGPFPQTTLPLRYTVERIVTVFLATLWGALPDAAKPEIPTLIGAGTETARYSILLRALARKEERTYYTGEGLAINMRFWWYIAPGPWRFGIWLAILTAVPIFLFVLSA